MPKNRIKRLCDLESEIIHYVSKKQPCTTNQVTVEVNKNIKVSFKTVKKYLIGLEESGKVKNISQSQFSLWMIK